MSVRCCFLSVLTLWEFLLELLADPTYQNLISWDNRKTGTFVIKDSEVTAALWGLHRRKDGMNYDKMSRALRYYYKKKLLRKVSRLCLVPFVPVCCLDLSLHCCVRLHGMHGNDFKVAGAFLQDLLNQENKRLDFFQSRICQVYSAAVGKIGHLQSFKENPAEM